MYAGFNSHLNEGLQVAKRLVELLPSYDNENIAKIILPNSRHVSSIKQERVLFEKEA